MTRILVFGKNGQLATALAGAGAGTDFELLFYGKSEFNLISQTSNIKRFIDDISGIDCVINASAYTNVDKAERQEWEAAFMLNALVPQHMAKACRDKKIPFIHISTESVFDGLKREPYLPDDKTEPANFYGLTKFLGEDLVGKTGGQNTVFRTSWVFAATGDNFVNSIVKAAKENPTIQVVNDQTGLPTYAPDLANAVLGAVRILLGNPAQLPAPVYHIAGGGAPINRYEFAKLIVQSLDLSTRVKPISSAQFAAPAPRPQNAVLDSASFTATFGIELPDWRIGLEQMLSQMGK